MGGISDFLFGGSNQSTEVRQRLPQHIEQGSREALDRARELSDREYTPYTGQRVAGLAPNQRRANRQARQAFGRAGDMVQSGFGLADRVANNRWDRQAAQRYMNPYVEQALDPAIRRINEEAQQNAIGGRAGMIQQGGVGAFGDARTAVMEGEMEEARLRGVGDTMATGLANAYDRAHEAWAGHQDRRLRAADLMGVQGGRSQAVTSQGIADLASTGAMRQAQDQRSLDTAYGDFLEERDWDERGLDYYIRALSGVPFARSETSSGNTGASLAQQAVGLGVTGAGLWNLFS